MYLMHFEPGARGDFLNEWLTDQVSISYTSRHNKNMKIHNLCDNLMCMPNPQEINSLKKMLSVSRLYKIRINTIGSLAQVLFDKIQKNPYKKVSDYDYSTMYADGAANYHYNRAMFDIVHCYDMVVPYHMLTNIDGLVELYEKVKNSKPKDKLIDDAKANLSLQISYKTCRDAYQSYQYARLEQISNSIPAIYNKLITPNDHESYSRYEIDLPLITDFT